MTAGTSRRFWGWFSAIVALAFAVRAANALFLLQPANPHFDPARCVGADMWGNDLQAREVVANGGFPKEFYHHAPLYVYLAAAVYAVTDRNFATVYWIQVVIGALLCGLVYWIGRRAWDERVGRIAGFAQALYGPLIFNEVTFMADALAPAMLMALIAMLLVAQRLERRLLAFAAALGVVLGLTISIRANFALLAPAIALWMLVALRQFPLRRRAASVALVAAISLLVVAPFCYHNTKSKGRLSFTQVEGEKPWRMSWGKESTGYFYYPQGYPENPMHSAASLDWAPLLARKVRFLFSWYEFPDLYNYYIDGRHSPLLRWSPITFWLIGPLGLIGIAVNLKRARGDLAPVYYSLAILLFGLLLFYIAGRFRAAMMPLFILFAASAAVWFFEKMRSRDWLRVGPAVAAWGLLLWGCLSLDPSGFHSIWYSDSMIENALLTDADKALAAKDFAKARTVADRLLWIRRAQAQLAGYSLHAEIDRVENNGRLEGPNAEIAMRLLPLVNRQPQIDQFGGAFFPPTAGFDPIDPFAAVDPPEGAMGIPRRAKE